VEEAKDMGVAVKRLRTVIYGLIAGFLLKIAIILIELGYLALAFIIGLALVYLVYRFVEDGEGDGDEYRREEDVWA
jgi:asparagine N-glycosylation enzyme membrane subunit Stt3